MTSILAALAAGFLTGAVVTLNVSARIARSRNPLVLTDHRQEGA